jgi:hypothetical protein
MKPLKPCSKGVSLGKPWNPKFHLDNVYRLKFSGMSRMVSVFS